MTSTVPSWIAWPLIVAMGVIIAIRCRWFSKSLYDVYFNNTLLLMLIAQLLREDAVENTLQRYAVMTITMAQHLSLVLVFFMAAEFMGFITRWSGLSPEETRRRHRYHRIAASILAAGFFAGTTRARVSGQLLEVAGGWDNVIAWGLYAVLPVALAVQMVKMCIREIRRPDAKLRERLVAGSAIPIGTAIGITTLIAVFLELFEQLGWAHTLNYRLDKHSYIFFWEAIGTTVVAAIPVVVAFIGSLGMDPTSRKWRQLQQLRLDMNAAVPGTALEIMHGSAGRRKKPLQLHQSTVEIRDAILKLRPYFRDVTPEIERQFFAKYPVPQDQRKEASLALQLSSAVAAKGSGAEAPAPTDAAMIASSRPATLGEETAELLRLSRWWPTAKIWTEQHQTVSR